MFMSSSATTPLPANLSLEGLYREILDLRVRLEDLEDLRELEEAKVRNAGRPGIPWEQVKAELIEG